LYSIGQRLTRSGRAFEIGAGEPDGPRFATPRELFGVCGAACLLRREAFEQLGGYDERFFAFYEDVDFNIRARLAGWSFVYVPDAEAVHVGAASWAGSPDGSRFNARLVARNRPATALRALPRGCLLDVAVAEFGSIVRSVRTGTFRAT